MSEQSVDLEFRVVSVEPWSRFKPEVAKKDGKTYVRKKGKDVVYVQTDDGHKCTTCDSTIQAVNVAHPIWTSKGAGYGECHSEQVPYCPVCEKKPESRGAPVRVYKGHKLN